MASEFLPLLVDNRAISRERGLAALRRHLLTPEADFPLLAATVFTALHESAWEQQLAGLIIARELLAKGGLTCLQPTLAEEAKRLLHHNEGKIRTVCVEILEGVSRLGGDEVFQDFFKFLTEKVAQLAESSDSGEFYETYLKAILAIVCASNGPLTSETAFILITLAQQVKSLQWKYPREAAQSLVKEICGKATTESVTQISDGIVQTLAQGLEDSWGPVRLLALQATKAFLTALGPVIHLYDSVLLPRVCLCRCFAAEGVRTQALEVWKMLVGDSGRQKIAEFAREVCLYYCDMCGADTPAVREAACICIAELATKVAAVAHASISPYAESLLSAVSERLSDPDWTVQDSSCVSCTELVCAFPSETSVRYSDMKREWLQRLSDPRVSMRETSAFGLVKSADVLKQTESHWTEIEEYIRNNGRKAWEQSAYERDNPPRGKSGPPYPWEISDGCVFLIREMTTVRPSSGVSYLPLVADLSRVHDFSAHLFLKDSIWRSLPVIAKSLGKRVFKDHLELFIDELFADAISSIENLRAVSSECIRELSRLIGPSIFRGRVEMHRSDFGLTLTRILAERG